MPTQGDALGCVIYAPSGRMALTLGPKLSCSTAYDGEDEAPFQTKPDGLTAAFLAAWTAPAATRQSRYAATHIVPSIAPRSRFCLSPCASTDSTDRPPQVPDLAHSPR